MIHITPAAAAQFKVELNLNAQKGVRLSVKGGGCSGFLTSLDFDDPKPEDKIINFEGGQLFVDPKSYLYVMDAIIDYSGGLNGKGFSVEVLGATKSCGCGNSFSF